MLFFTCHRKKEKKPPPFVEPDLGTSIAETKMKVRMMISCLREIQLPVKNLMGLTDIIPVMDENSSLHEYAVTINTFGVLLAEMIDNIRLYYQLCSGTYEYVPSDFILLSELRVMWQNLIMKATQKTQRRFFVHRTGDIRCSLTISDNVPNAIVSTDALCLQKVFYAVIYNAIRFTQEGEVKVTVSATNNTGQSQCMLNFIVSDTGIGVPRDFRGILFEPMTKGHSDTVEGGTGMGLAVARLLCRELGGDLVLTDQLTEGSTFHAFILLKCRSIVSWQGSEWHEETTFEFEELPSSRLPSTVTPHIKEDDRQMPRILVVEDIALNREILRHSLNRVHVNVTMSLDGEDAIHKCEEMTYDLILMDIYMPKMNGIDACKKIKQECPLNADTPIVALSGSTCTDTMKDCLAAGMTEMMVKPISHRVLIKTIYETLTKPEHQQWLTYHDAST
ncbi:FirrV-1-B9 [Feldmannia irregularis virus a]|uniref:FirrV-1-B9 n=1 Tax=Feldmannia irregularis virus a TaxID=231992 RepID=Q6XM27_9PHYC|nr:FirrV-1-B9 [Feldmannia irregularis virus a]AAR26884.1 FirrV-1-B9 [Feldmannia irregularis virus a]